MWGRGWAVGCVLVALFAAGCVSPFADPVERVCYSGDASAVWSEPGLFFGLTGAAQEAGLLPVGRFGFEGPALVEGGHWDRGVWASDRWVGVEFRDAASGMRVVLSPGESGRYEVTVRGSGHDEGGLAPFRSFVGALGLAHSPELPVWERALLSTARQGAYLHVDIDAVPRFAALHERVAVGAPVVEPAVSVGTGRLVWGEWTFVYRLGSFAYEVPRGDSAPVLLHVAEDDRVVASMAVGATDAPWPDLQRGVNETFAALGLPAPTYQELGRRPPTCDGARSTGQL